MKYQNQYTNQTLFFDKSVAAIDIITLNGVAKAIDPHVRYQEIVLPSVAENIQTAFFDSLMHIEIYPETLFAKAVIDTKKMTWSEEVKASRSTLTDYTGTLRLGVSFSKLEVANIGSVLVTTAALTLEDGRTALMWFAEVPQETLSNIGYYDLFNLASRLTVSFNDIVPEKYDQVIVPAQQIDYERTMSEIVELNKGELKEVLQKFKVGIDNTGARVEAETVLRLGASRPQSEHEFKKAVFGSKNPVIFWLTELQNTIPFAVVATKSEAWLDPNQTVSFDF